MEVLKKEKTIDNYDKDFRGTSGLLSALLLHAPVHKREEVFDSLTFDTLVSSISVMNDSILTLKTGKIENITLKKEYTDFVNLIKELENLITYFKKFKFDNGGKPTSETKIIIGQEKDAFKNNIVSIKELIEHVSNMSTLLKRSMTYQNFKDDPVYMFVQKFTQEQKDNSLESYTKKEELIEEYLKTSLIANTPESPETSLTSPSPTSPSPTSPSLKLKTNNQIINQAIQFMIDNAKPTDGYNPLINLLLPVRLQLRNCCKYINCQSILPSIIKSNLKNISIYINQTNDNKTTNAFKLLEKFANELLESVKKFSYNNGVWPIQHPLEKNIYDNIKILQIDEESFYSGKKSDIIRLIKKAHRNAQLKYHPDRDSNSDPQIYFKLGNAHDELIYQLKQSYVLIDEDYFITEAPITFHINIQSAPESSFLSSALPMTSPAALPSPSVSDEDLIKALVVNNPNFVRALMDTTRIEDVTDKNIVNHIHLSEQTKSALQNYHDKRTVETASAASTSIDILVDNTVNLKNNSKYKNNSNIPLTKLSHEELNASKKDSGTSSSFWNPATITALGIAGVAGIAGIYKFLKNKETSKDDESGSEDDESLFKYIKTSEEDESLFKDNDKYSKTFKKHGDANVYVVHRLETIKELHKLMEKEFNELMGEEFDKNPSNKEKHINIKKIGRFLYQLYNYYNENVKNPNEQKQVKYKIYRPEEDKKLIILMMKMYLVYKVERFINAIRSNINDSKTNNDKSGILGKLGSSRHILSEFLRQKQIFDKSFYLERHSKFMISGDNKADIRLRSYIDSVKLMCIDDSIPSVNDEYKKRLSSLDWNSMFLSIKGCLIYGSYFERKTENNSKYNDVVPCIYYVGKDYADNVFKRIQQMYESTSNVKSKSSVFIKTCISEIETFVNSIIFTNIPVENIKKIRYKLLYYYNKYIVPLIYIHTLYRIKTTMKYSNVHGFMIQNYKAISREHDDKHNNDESIKSLLLNEDSSNSTIHTIELCCQKFTKLCGIVLKTRLNMLHETNRKENPTINFNAIMIPYINSKELVIHFSILQSIILSSIFPLYQCINSYYTQIPYLVKIQNAEIPLPSLPPQEPESNRSIFTDEFQKSEERSLSETPTKTSTYQESPRKFLLNSKFLENVVYSPGGTARDGYEPYQLFSPGGTAQGDAVYEAY